MRKRRRRGKKRISFRDKNGREWETGEKERSILGA